MRMNQCPDGGNVPDTDLLLLKKGPRAQGRDYWEFLGGGWGGFSLLQNVAVEHQTL